ncbi:MAG: hypothetical protein DLM53_07035 [Candidatus Eremiobacter antarcticus]|nr:DMT family transporter [Candidatus Eremiobacteraeota bacterium]MBC5808739.1 DMT family transporter [Candidatus Eremiobacteraeota bacterium]PZR62212.1 MAG: hypothetical protein DLM53_07035 [Candidatus Eremiobacter sp. RRmetagenome_bin22]
MKQHRGFVAIMVAAVLWGAGWPVLKLLTKSAPALEVMFGELAAASVFAGVVTAVRHVKVRDWSRVRIAAAIGIVEPGVAYLLFALGIAQTTASSATIIDSLQPLVILLIAALAFGERSGPGALPLVVLGLCGTGLSLGLNSISLGDARLAGDTLVGLGMIMAALHAVIMKRAVVELDAVLVTTVQHVTGACILGSAAVLLIWAHPATFWTVNARDIVLIAGAGVLTMGMPFLLYITAVRQISGGLAGIGIAFIPISGLVLSALFVGERLAPIQVAGAVVTVIALVAAARIETNYQYVPRSLA